MKEIVEKLTSNPLGTAILIGSISGGIVSIIRAIKGVPANPGLVINWKGKKSRVIRLANNTLSVMEEY